MKPQFSLPSKTVTCYLVFIITLLSANVCTAQGSRAVNFAVNVNEGRLEISPYIYSVNFFRFPPDSLVNVNITGRRLGGNAFSSYNWLNNAVTLSPENVQSHKYENSNRIAEDLPPAEQDKPASAITHFQNLDIEHHWTSLVTIPIMSYVAKDKNGIINDDEAPPSGRFVENRGFKQGSLSLTPDSRSNTVYADECIHFLVNKFGDARSNTGIKFYALDNEPDYWSWEHKFLHPSKQMGAELINKSITFAKAIKSQDPNALVFALSYGSVWGHWSLDNDADYNRVKNQYPNYTAWFLKSLKDASDQAGMNLIDVVDMHFYSLAQAAANNGKPQRAFDGNDDKGVANVRMNATRSLWDKDFSEESVWTTKDNGVPLDVIPDLQKTIDRYYPGLKISFGEYNFGGWNHISGGIAEADALGIFAKNRVFWASLWNTYLPPPALPHYQLAAIKMFRNYDGRFSTFGNTLVSATNQTKNGREDKSSSIYAAFSNQYELHIIVINKDYDKSISGNFSVSGTTNYTSGEVWKLDGSSPTITKTAPIAGISHNSFNYTVPPLTILHIVLKSQ